MEEIVTVVTTRIIIIKVCDNGDKGDSC